MVLRRKNSLFLLAILVGCGGTAAAPPAPPAAVKPSGSVALTSGQVEVGPMTDHCIAKVKFTNKTSKAIAVLSLSIEFHNPGRTVPECKAYESRIDIPSGIEPGESKEITQKIRFTEGQKVVENKQLEASFQLLSPDGEFAPSSKLRGSIVR